MVRSGIGSDPRIGPHISVCRLGYGGSCFPKMLKRSPTLPGKRHAVGDIGISAACQQDSARPLCEQDFSHFGNDSIEGKLFALWD